MNTYMTPLILKRLLKVSPFDLHYKANHLPRGFHDSYVTLVYTEGYERKFYQEKNLILHPDTQWSRSEKGFIITPAGRAHAAKATMSDLFPGVDFDAGTSSERAKGHLWMHLAMKGKTAEWYDSYSRYEPYDWFPTEKLLHMLICGLDFEKSSTPTISGWESFAGTFDEAEKHNGLVGSATCRCGEAENEEVVLTDETFETLIPVILGEDA